MPLSNFTLLLFVCADETHNHDIQAFRQRQHIGLVPDSQSEALDAPHRTASSIRSTLNLLDQVALRHGPL
jgi:hypothetical protein